ncbi:MAG: glycosyltransferase [Pseudomonadota bacterium]
MKPRVLIVTPSLSAGGAERSAMNLAGALAGEGWKISVAVLNETPGPAITVPHGVGLFSLSTARRTHPLVAILHLAVVARQFEIVLAAQEAAATTFSWAACRLARRPLLAWTHIAYAKFESAMLPRDRFIARAVYRRLPHLVFPSEGALRSLATVVSKPASATWRVVPNFIEPRSDDPAAPAWREEWSAWFGCPVLLTVARLVQQKALDRLIRAHRVLLDQGVAHHLIIAGSGSELPTLRAEVNRLSVGGTTFFAGHVENPTELYRRATVFGMCSRFEGFGMTLLEAMTAGLPVVAMDCESGPREVLDGGRAGVLTPDGDERAFTDALARLLTDPAARRHYAAAGRARAAEYTPERVMPQWEALLVEVAGRSRPRPVRARP